MLATTLTTILRRQGAIEAPYVFSPSELFASGEEGCWYDPSDFTTLFTDTAGTTAITAVEQPVGYMADKSGNGNHAVAANGSTARPVLRNRYNLLTYSEQFDNAAWIKSETTISANSTTAPDGTATADAIYETVTNSLHTVRQLITGTSGATYKFSVYAKPNGRSLFALQINSKYAYFNLTGSGSIGTQVNATGAIQAKANGWYLCTLTVTTTTTNVDPYVYLVQSDPVPTYAGDVTKGVYIWGAQLTTAADDAAINGEYQQIAAAPTVGAAPTYDDDVTKFPPYLYATTDDAMSTASIDFSSGDEMSVFAGVTKQQDAATAVVVENSNNPLTQSGVFGILAPSTNGANSYRYFSGATDLSEGLYGIFAAAPDTSVLTGISDISADVSTLRRNGALVGTDTTDQGSGNYGNYPLYLFARNNSSIFYTGRLYSLIVRNALTSGDELDNVEAYVAQKTGVTL